MTSRRKCTFFLGAGASCADGYPTTNQLWYGIAWALRGVKKISELATLVEYLKIVYGITSADIDRSAEVWDALLADGKPPESVTSELDVTELISTLDVLIDEDSAIALSADKKRNLQGRELRYVRDRAVVSLARAFRELDLRRSHGKEHSIVRDLVHSAPRGSTFISTNWDLLLDFGICNDAEDTAPSYGSDVELYPKRVRMDKKLPMLLKLHGAFNWLVCRRCTRLYVNVREYISHLPDAIERLSAVKKKRIDVECDCRAVLSPLIVTPSYLKDYRSRHLANVWATAMRKLASSDEWVFVGYSLPPDDVHIRVLLLKAALMRRKKVTRIVVVNRDRSVQARYKQLFRKLLHSSEERGLPADEMYQFHRGLREYVASVRK